MSEGELMVHIPPLTKQHKRRIRQLKAMPVAEILSDLDAMHQMLCMWMDNYGSEGEPRLAMITGMLADVVTILRHGLADIVRT